MSYISSQHHSFDIALAEQYGIDCAIMIHHFQHWIRINRAGKRNFHEGKTWSYQTLKSICEHFPYWSEMKVRNILHRLCMGKGRESKKTGTYFEPVLIKGNFNKAGFDKTSWYAFIDSKFLYDGQNCQMEKSELPNGSGGSAQPIPDTIPYPKPDAESNPLPQTPIPHSEPDRVEGMGMRDDLTDRRGDNGLFQDIDISPEDKLRFRRNFDLEKLWKITDMIRSTLFECKKDHSSAIAFYCKNPEKLIAEFRRCCVKSKIHKYGLKNVKFGRDFVENTETSKDLSLYASDDDDTWEIRFNAIFLGGLT